MRIAIALLFLLTLPLCVNADSQREASCAVYPAGLTFVGLVDDVWHLFFVEADAKQPRIVQTLGEVRAPVPSADLKNIVFVADGGDIKEIAVADMTEKTLLKNTDQSSFTQPARQQTGSAIYLVELIQGNSVDTDIFKLHENGQKEIVVSQRSAQFEPFEKNNWLYYSNVHCVTGCGKIIQEIWRRNIISGIAEQLTLNGGISRQPVVSEDGEWLYYSSNYQGAYKIYRQSLFNSRVEQVTDGDGTDVSPVLSGNALYFIRHGSGGNSNILCAGADLVFQSMPMPPGVSRVRELSVRL